MLPEYKPKSPNLDHLGKRAAALAPSLGDVFPKSESEVKRLWNLLKKADIDAR